MREIPHPVCNPLVHYVIHKSLSLDPIPDQINPVCTHTPNFLQICLPHISPHILHRSPKSSLPFKLSDQNSYAFLIFPICATCSIHVIILEIINLIIFGEEYTLLSFLLCTFLCFYISLSLLCFSLNMRNQV
jgi:hypothetical protein